MKKCLSFLAVVLCACLMAVPVSAAQASAYKLYSNAVKKMGDVTSLQIDGSIKMTMTVGEGDAIPFEMGFTALQRVNSKGQVEMSIIMDENDLGIEMEAYYRNGYYYMNANGEKTRVKMPEADALGQAGLNFDSAEEFFEEATVEELSNGRRIKYKVPGKYVSEVMGDSMGAVISQNDSGATAKIGTITCYTTLDKSGRIKSERMAYTMTLSGSQNVKIRYNVSMKYSNINEIDEIYFPSGLKSYKKITSSSQSSDTRSSEEALASAGSTVAL